MLFNLLIKDFFFRFYSINFDGSCQQYLGESPINIFSVVYFESALYMTVWGSNSVMKYDIVRNKTINIITYESRPYGLAVHQAPPIRKLNFKLIYS